MALPDDDKADLPSVYVPANRQPDDWGGGLQPQATSSVQAMPPISRPHRPMTYGPKEVHGVGRLDEDGTRLD